MKRILFATFIGVLTVVLSVLLFPELVFNSNGGTGLAERFQVGPIEISRKGALKTYNDITHGFFVICVLSTLIYLLVRYIKTATRPFLLIDTNSIRSLSTLFRSHALTSIVFLFYVAAMLHGASWYFGEVIGWFDGIYRDDLLNNFSLNSELVKETMRRNDFRFFPLAHQDLQILGWFTPYVKVWMLVNALELLIIVIVSVRFTQRLTGATGPLLVLGAALLFLIQPAAAKPFFQFPYSERMLVFFYALFIYSYLAYQQTRCEKYLYAVLATATLGIFFKDTAFLLFSIPAAVTLAFGSLGKLQGYVATKGTSPQAWLNSYRLELWLIGLTGVFFASYFVLSFLPSIVSANEVYKPSGTRLSLNGLSEDIRLWVLLSVFGFRSILIVLGRASPGILDSANLAAILYALAITYLIGLDTHSYLALPIQFVAALNILFLWGMVSARTRTAPGVQHAVSIFALLTIVVLIAYEHTHKPNFFNAVLDIKAQQTAWMKTFHKAESFAQRKNARGEAVNVLYTKSWFRHYRHLDRINYDRLVFLDPKNLTYTVMKGANQGEQYTPQSGDLLVNPDNRDIHLIRDELAKYRVLFDANPNLRNGKIYEYQ